LLTFQSSKNKKSNINTDRKAAIMIYINTYFDKTRARKTGKGGIYISVIHRKKRTLISLNIELSSEQWDGNNVVNHPNKNMLNNYITRRRIDADYTAKFLEMSDDYTDMTTDDVFEKIRERIDPDYNESKRQRRHKDRQLLDFYEKYVNTKTNPGTRSVYAFTLRKLRSYLESTNKDPKTVRLDDINKIWLQQFEAWCHKTEQRNTTNIHLRNLRAAFNAAIDAGLCSNYPFRRYRIRQVETRDKSLRSNELRMLFNARYNNRGEETAADIFKLMFCLIGINGVDLFDAGKPVSGRLEYTRTKTGKQYSINIEPEAMRIIEKYSGRNTLLNLCEQYGNYKTFFNRAAKSLRKIGTECVPGKKSEGKPLFPEICYGTARTAWATIAQEELDIPRDTIAAALGHCTTDFSDTYMRTKWKAKIDKANRQMLDHIFGAKNNPD